MNSCASSKHLQTRRYLDTLQGYVLDIQRLLIQLHRSANARPAPFVDHAGILRDSKTGRALNGHANHDSDDDSITMRELPAYSPCRERNLTVLQSWILVLRQRRCGVGWSS